MEIKVIKAEKNELEIELNNLTVAELLRNVLWQDSATEFAAWKREHPTKNPHLVLKTKGKIAKKVLLDTLTSTQKTLSQLTKEFKKV